jgi:hypothetical protein
VDDAVERSVGQERHRKGNHALTKNNRFYLLLNFKRMKINKFVRVGQTTLIVGLAGERTQTSYRLRYPLRQESLAIIPHSVPVLKPEVGSFAV